MNKMVTKSSVFRVNKVFRFVPIGKQGKIKGVDYILKTNMGEENEW